MKRVHYFSGGIISLFVGLHLLNHLYSVFGISAHLELMDSLRVVYRNVFAESMLFFALVIQIFSGIPLFLRKRKTAAGFFEKMQSWTGLYLAFFLVVHVSAVLSGRLLLNLDTNFYFGAAGLNTFPLNLFFIPYYGLAIMSFFGHISAVHSLKMKYSLLGITPIKQSYLILALGITVTLIILYGLTDGLHGVEIPREYDVIIGK